MDGHEVVGSAVRGASPEYLGHLLDAAVSAPGAAADPASRRLVAELLAELAATGDVTRVERVLAVRRGMGSSYEVRAYAAGSVVPSDVAHPADGAAAVLAAIERCATTDDSVEVVADDGLGLTRSVLTRSVGGELRYRFPDMTSYHHAAGNELAIERAVASWVVAAEPVEIPAVAAEPIVATVDVEALADAVRSRLPETTPPPPAPTVDVHAIADAVRDRVPSPVAPEPLDVDALAAVVADAVADRVPPAPSGEQLAFAARAGLAEGLEGSFIAERVARMPTRTEVEGAVEAAVHKIVDAVAPLLAGPGDIANSVVDRLKSELSRLSDELQDNWQATAKVGREAKAQRLELEQLAEVVADAERRLSNEVAQWLDILREEVRHLAKLHTADLAAIQQQLRAVGERGRPDPASEPAEVIDIRKPAEVRLIGPVTG